MKIENKLLLRKIKKQFTQLLAAALIVAIGVGFFVTLKTVLFQYENMSEQYYKHYSLADYTIYSVGLDQSDVDKIKHIDGVNAAQGRFVADFKSGAATIRALSIPFKESLINKPYIYQGRHLENDDECMLLQKYAKANNLEIGDTIEIKIQNQKYVFKIAGLVSSPEYVYLVQSESVPMADAHDFGITFISENFFKSRLNSGYNQINVLFDDGADTAKIAEKIKEALIPKRISYDLFKSGQTSYKMYKDDLKQIDTLAYIFPVIFFIIGSMMIYVMQKRNVTKERKQIGIIKAMGLSDIKILFIYTKYSVLIAFLGSIGGCLLSISIGDYILNVFGEMFEIPGLAFTFYFYLWAVAFLLSLIVCVISNFVGIKAILKITPAEAMHAEKPKSGKKILLENIKPLWNSLSFNTRYALKASLRNKGRFFAVVLGMTAAVALTVFALGFNNSFDYLINNHYETFTKYDLAVSVQTTPLEKDIDVVSMPGVEKYSKATILPIKVEKDSKNLDYPLLITESGFDMLDIKNDTGKAVNLQDGIVLPIYIADKLGVSKGDKVKISSPSSSFDDVEVSISDLSIQASSFYVYTKFDFIKEKLNFDKAIYNTIFLKSNGDVKGLSKLINDSKSVISTTSKEQDKSTMLKLLDTISFMIQVIIVFAVILGIAVLYAVGIINLTARSYEFVVLKVMGYDTKDIVLACIKENLFQLILSLPFGFLLGNLIILGIKDEFSNDSFALTLHIYGESYWFAAILLIAISALIMIMSIRFINRVDMIEGLKSREE
ncbi:MAG: ABC transporter permease [Clostridia bacterium]|nr:ABC transporter permease [Clostridia bacterium]